MTGQPAYTDADVQAALAAFWAQHGYVDHETMLRAVLDAVAPAIAARALREVADVDEVDDIEGAPIRDDDGSTLLWLHQPRQISEWLNRRADEIEAGR